MIIRWIAVLSFSALLTVQVSDAQEGAIEADDVVNSIGVNTHFCYTDTSYFQKYPQVITALKSAGIRHVRDGYYDWPAGNQMYKIHQALKTAGIGTNYVLAYNPSTTVSDLESFQALAGDMESIEPPNEFDDNGGTNWTSTLLSFLPMLQQAGQALNVPVLGPSLVHQSSYSALGNISQYQDYSNLHIYFGGRHPGTAGWGSGDAEGNSYGSILWWLDNANTIAPGAPSYVTESGYLQSSTTKRPYTVPYSVASLYTIQTILEMMTHGIRRTYMYELLDDPTSNGYGLMTSKLQPKYSYNALKALTGLLSDQGASFSPGELQYTLTGSTKNVHHLLMQKRDGSFYLALWVNLPVYNPANNTTINVAPQAVTVTLDSGHEVQSNSYIDSTGSLHTSNVNSYAYDLNLTPTVTFLKIVPNS